MNSVDTVTRHTGARRRRRHEDARRNRFTSELPPPYAQTYTQTYAPTEAGVTAELRDFIAHISLNDEEVAQRHKLIAAVEQSVAELWPNAKHNNNNNQNNSSESENSHCTPIVAPRIVPYGSFALGLSTPTSDIDLTVLFDDDSSSSSSGSSDGVCRSEKKGEEREAMSGQVDFAEMEARRLRRLHQIAQKLATAGFSVKVYDFCRVPVAKIRDPLNNLSCDLNVCLAGVEKVLTRQRGWLAQHSEAHDLILVTKAALKQWGLNSLFHGGLSSTALYMLVRRFVEHQQQPSTITNTTTTTSKNNNHININNPHPYQTNSNSASHSIGCKLTAKRLLDFWRYASMDVFLDGYNLYDAFATDDATIPDGARDLSAGSYRLPDVIAMLRHAAILLEDAMTRHSMLRFHTQGLAAILTDPRRERMGNAAAVAASGVCKRQRPPLRATS